MFLCSKRKKVSTDPLERKTSRSESLPIEKVLPILWEILVRIKIGKFNFLKLFGFFRHDPKSRSRSDFEVQVFSVIMAKHLVTVK